MHCPGSRPRASSKVLLMAAMDSPAIAWAPSAVKSVQASSGSAAGALASAPLESAEPPQPAASTAAKRNDGTRSRRREDWVTGSPSLVSGRDCILNPRKTLQDLDLPALSRLTVGQRDCDLQDAVLEVGLRLVRLGSLGQRDGAEEPAVAALAPVDAPLVLFLLLAPLALEEEIVVVDLELDVFLPQSRQVGADDEVAPTLGDFDLGIPEAAAAHGA